MRSWKKKKEEEKNNPIFVAGGEKRASLGRRERGDTLLESYNTPCFFISQRWEEEEGEKEKEEMEKTFVASK